MDDNTGPPPPSYAEAVGLARDTPSISASDPQLAPGGSRYNGNWGSHSQQGGSSQTELVTDSPHSSDDEETVMLKKRLRRIREEKRLNEENERKKLLLRQMLEQEERSVGASSEVHPLSTNVPDHSVASYRRSDLHPSYYASQRPHPSAPEPEPSNQENHSSAIFHPMTTYTPEAPFTGARRSDLHPSYTAQGLNSASGPTNQASTATGTPVNEGDIFGKLCLKCFGTIVGGGFILLVIILLVTST